MRGEMQAAARAVDYGNRGTYHLAMALSAKKILANALLTIGSLAITLLLVVAIDRVAGRISPSNELEPGLIYPPHTAAYYDTIEFKCTVYTNNLGFRGEDTTLEKTHALRVVAIGDSFTYGWGVDLADTWIKQLEAALRAEGRDVEILNLGVPGANPGQYAQTAERVIPVLKPDLVLVGVLQGDDLEQVERWKPKQPATDSMEAPREPEQQTSMANAITRRLVPNLSRISVNALRSASPQTAMTITGRMTLVRDKWKEQARAFVDNMTEADLKMFYLSTASIREAFLAGQLNPAQLRWLYPESAKPKSARKPATPPPAASSAPAAPPNNESTPTEQKPAPVNPALNLNSKLMQRRIDLCVPYLESIRKVADNNGARVVVMSVPEVTFMTVSGWQRLFEPLNTPDMLRDRDAKFTTTVQDQAVQLACDRAGIPMVEVTAAYRDASKKDAKLYYDYDGHFTPEGNRVFANLLLPVLRPYLEPIANR